MSFFQFSFISIMIVGLSITVHAIAGDHKSIVNEGEDALIPCTLKKSYSNDTVLWRKASTNEILSAGLNRVSADKRINVLHDKSFNKHPKRDEDVWVLFIKNTQLSDTDLYVCELNGEPVLKTFHSLEVVVKNITNGLASVTTRKIPTMKPIIQMMKSSTVTVTTTAETPIKSTSSTIESSEMKVLWSFPSNHLVEKKPPLPSLPHDFTDCCRSMNVSYKCMRYCSIHSLFSYSNYTNAADSCIQDFEHIVKCTAGGRNHVPCCKKKNIPDMCQNLCRGEYTPFNDYIKSRKTCGNYIIDHLTCIVEGIYTIPSEPNNVYVESINEKSIQVFWQAPEYLPNKVKNYLINVTKLHSFDQNHLGDLTTSVQSILVDRNVNTVLVNNLLPFTMYEVSVMATNKYGSSLPSFRVRTLTLDSGNSGGSNTRQMNDGAIVPALPDVRECCIKHGMTHLTCLDRMCDAKKADFNEIADLMVCAPWANISFSCLVNNIDHTPCCIARGIPNDCLLFCAGNVTTLTFASFKCLQYMADFNSCLLQNFGVLAGPPSRVIPLLESTTYAIISWQPPKILPDTVTEYHVYLRKLGSGTEYTVMEKERQPIIIQDLEPGTRYEVFVVSLNAHGKGGPSPRLVLQTKQMIDDIPTIAISSYNMTACCSLNKILPQCMPLCTHDMKLSDLENLYGTCQPQLGAIAKCAAGGRDHTSCCIRRGVPDTCLPYCRGLLPETPVNCLALYGGSIIECYDEVENLHATFITNSSISLEWASSTMPMLLPSSLNPSKNSLLPSSLTTTTTSSLLLSSTSSTLSSLRSPSSSVAESADAETVAITPTKAKALSTLLKGNENVTDVVRVIDFLVQYGKLDNMTWNDTVIKMENEINTTETEIELMNLNANTVYGVSVIARSEYGTSLPSSLLIINTTNEANYSAQIYGLPSPPHSLAASSISATWLMISWQPPVFHHSHVSISYKIYHKSFSDDKFSVIETRLLWKRFDNLIPNSQYVFYVVTISGKNNELSLPSEKIVVWTHPAVSAIVDPPTINPLDIIIEGTSISVLCLALGDPTPTISLYVGGKLIKRETTRHMVSLIPNVTRSMDNVLCYADNGYGMPMQLSKKIQISFGPHIDAPEYISAAVGMSVDIKCKVNAKPTPKVIFWRDHNGRVPVILGNNYHMKIDNDTEDSSRFTMRLSIDRLTDEQFGDYFCHAENIHGSATQLISLRMKSPSNAFHNITDCCIAENVSAACRSACGYFIDIDMVKDRAECLVDFDRLMKCAADNLDHQSCCANANVPRRCLNWCRGEGVIDTEKDICALQYTKTIIDCFQINHERLPGVPQNIQVRRTIDGAILITWEPPKKNPNMVEGYRVYWQEIAENLTNSDDEHLIVTRINGHGIYYVDTKELQVRTIDLQTNVFYKITVRAANQYGSSILAKPIEFRMTNNRVYSSLYGRSRSRTYLGILGIILFVIVFVCVAMKLYKRRTLKTNTNGVAFENPSYLREMSIEHIPVQMTDVNITDLTSNWHQERLQLSTIGATTIGMSNNDATTHRNCMVRSSTATSAVMVEAEIKPTLYEELKLGHEGAGFKRLV